MRLETHRGRSVRHGGSSEKLSLDLCCLHLTLHMPLIFFLKTEPPKCIECS